MDKLVITTRGRLEKEIAKRIESADQDSTRRYERDLLMKQTDLAALQSQINPHFLYNALECIRGQALIDGSQAVADITQALSRFFRYSISGKQDCANICDELENARNYMMIQQFRFRNRFSYEIVVEDPETAEMGTISKMSLQPILENAIVHGFEDVSSGGKILITVKRVGKNVSLAVSDNGKGMSPERLKLLNESVNRRDDSMYRGETSSHSGIGLQNVNRRLKLFFGQPYGLGISSIQGVGTRIELFFPFVTLEEKDEGGTV